MREARFISAQRVLRENGTVQDEPLTAEDVVPFHIREAVANLPMPTGLADGLGHESGLGLL